MNICGRPQRMTWRSQSISCISWTPWTAVHLLHGSSEMESSIALITHWNGEAAAALHHMVAMTWKPHSIQCISWRHHNRFPPHIWCMGTCVMRMWRERVEIIDVPEWDLFVMGIIDRSGHHRATIAPHRLRNGSPCQEPYLLIVCVFVWCVLGAFLRPTIRGLSLCVFGHTYGAFFVPVCMPSDDECSLTNWWKSISFVIEIRLHSDRINL